MKNIFFTGILICFFLSGKAQVSGWQHKDLKADHVFGISTDKAYAELLRNKEAQTVIVTIIDSGIDTLHEDLQASIWHNKQEIAANGIDDDHNGYTDDIIGWNFTGLSIKWDSLVKLIHTKGPFYDSLSYTKVPDGERAGFNRFNQLKKELEHVSFTLSQSLDNLVNYKKEIGLLVAATGKANPGFQDFKALLARDSSKRKILIPLIDLLPLFKDYQTFQSEALDRQLKNIRYAAGHLYSGPDSAGVISSLVDNNYDSSYNRIFTIPDDNNLVGFQPITAHGTHIAGIIGADRANVKGIKGIANRVKIMSLKIYTGLFPGFRDENLASAIRYAVDNGARVINLSLGSLETADKKILDDAVRYAMKKNVLIVRASGNDGRDMDELPGKGLYPTKYYLEGGEAAAWLTVGASDWEDNDTLAAKFSNYGATTVDVFAPGVQINSTIPGNRYQVFNGTSMAAPVVAGLAALIMEYYPRLTAIQVKEIIMRSAKKVNHKVYLPGKSAVKTEVPFSRLCVSGGIVNAYKALKLASTY